MTLKEIVNNPQTTIIDVRSEGEFQSGHFPGAKNIPLNIITQKLDELKQIKHPIVVYCMSGARSNSAASFLKQSGIDNIYDAGGIFQL
ncbi:MAG: rhodanese-like domain-containing protein [Flavobacteriales bacterium]|nr:rhodanese-like domain-containing protein [Flavobacteriales bacterium]